MESLIVTLIVGAAAASLVARLVRRASSAPEEGCAGGCGRCPAADAPGAPCGVAMTPPRIDTVAAPLPVVALGAALASALSLAAMLWSPPAQAADTVETWAVGATDVDFYTGVDRIGSDARGRALYGDLMLGFGLIEGLSAYLGTTLQADGTLSGGEPSTYLGVFGTVLDTDHVDLDLFFDVSASGAGRGTLQITPSVELNLDSAPDQGGWGAYLRLGVPVAGDSEGEPEGAVHHQSVAPTVHIDLNPGAYVALGDSGQLLVEYDMAWIPAPRDDEPSVDVGGLALGYNHVLSEALEIISQVHLDLPQEGESAAASLMLGFIATMPSATK